MQVADTTHGGSAGTNGTQMIVVTAGTGSSVQGTAGAGPSYATAVLQLAQTGTMSHIITDGNTTSGVGSDTITGQIAITNNGVQHTFVQGTGVDSATVKYTGGTTVAALTAKINADTVLGLSATAPNSGTGAIYLQATVAGTDTISASAGSTLADVGNGAAIYSSPGATTTGQTLVASNAGALNVGLAAGAMTSAPDPTVTANSTDVLKAGSTITVGFGANSRIFTVGDAIPANAATTTYVGTTAGGATMGQLAGAISGYGALAVTATAGTTGLVLSSTGVPTGPNQMIQATGINLTDNTLGTYSKMSLSGFGSESDTVSGTLNYKIGNATVPFALTSGETVQQMINQINLPASNSGITAQWNSGTNSVDITSGTEGTQGNLTPLGTTSVTDTTNTAAISYQASNAYSVGVSSDATNNVFDSTTLQNSVAVAGFAANQKSGSGIATISYSDGAGQSLSATDLSNATDAKASLTALNSAITAVAAQDGYIGAQINTLNAVSSVLSTQQQNVVSAQNAVQATDYASAASNMSKYEILSQTGISALAQANSMQQEVTKLLQ
jgi:flagellin